MKSLIRHNQQNAFNAVLSLVTNVEAFHESRMAHCKFFSGEIVSSDGALRYLVHSAVVEPQLDPSEVPE